MALEKYDWGRVEWNKQDVVIARELGCTRERVRQKRILMGKGKSEHHHEHGSIFKQKVKELDTTSLTINDVVTRVKCSKAYAINMLNKLGKDYNKVDGRRGGKYDWGKANWALKDWENAEILGVPNPSTVTQHRRRLGILKKRKSKVYRVVREGVM